MTELRLRRETADGRDEARLRLGRELLCCNDPARAMSAMGQLPPSRQGACYGEINTLSPDMARVRCERGMPETAVSKRSAIAWQGSLNRLMGEVPSQIAS